MKTIGLIGGTTWESTKEYYRIINELTRQKLGGVHSAKIILYSVDFNFIISSTWQEKIDLLHDLEEKMDKKKGGAILIASTIIWAAVILGSASVLNGTEYKEAVSRILVIGVIVHLQLFNMMLLWARKEKKTGKPTSYAGVTIILSAIIWGAVMIGTSIVLKGTEFKGEIARIIQGASVAHLLFIWVPIGIAGKKEKEKNKS